MPTPPRDSSAAWETDAPGAESPTGFADAGGLPTPRLWRSRSDRVVAGVIGGLAEKYGWEPLPARLLYALLTVLSGGLLAIPYLAIWAITRAHGPASPEPRLWRSRSNKIIAGVLGGLAEKFEVQPAFLRVLYVTISVLSAGFPGVLVYLILWAVMRPRDEWDDEAVYRGPRP